MTTHHLKYSIVSQRQPPAYHPYSTPFICLVGKPRQNHCGPSSNYPLNRPPRQYPIPLPHTNIQRNTPPPPTQIEPHPLIANPKPRRHRNQNRASTTTSEAPHSKTKPITHVPAIPTTSCHTHPNPLSPEIADTQMPRLVSCAID